MLTRFEVKGFKTLVDVAVDLGAVNIFIGANGSGKSNLLEAFSVIGAIASGQVNQEAFRYRGVRVSNLHNYLSFYKESLNNCLTFSVSDSHVQYLIELSVKGHQPARWRICSESVFLDGVETLQRATEESDDTSLVDLVNLNELKTFKEHMSLGSIILGIALLRNQIITDPTFPSSDLAKSDWKDKYLEFDQFFYRLSQLAIHTPTTPQLRGFLDDIHRDPLGLGGSGLGRAIEEMTSMDPEKLGPFDMDDVLDLIEWADEIGTDRSKNGKSSEVPIRLRMGDRFMVNGHKTVSAVEASEGALYVLFLLALVGHERSPKMFAVDNFDQALHPRLARELTKVVCDQIVADGTRQMFATTHNPLVLDGLDLLDDRIRLFAVDRDETGATKVERVVVTPKILELADAGMSLSRLWTMGRLGGVPQNF